MLPNYILSSYIMLYSLSVSPKPDQPLVAAVVELKGLEGKMVRIYNYKTKELKQEFELKGTSTMSQYYMEQVYITLL